MPRVLQIDSMTNKRICKSAGAGGYTGSKVQGLCHVKSRFGAQSQCFTCNIPNLTGYPKQVGCNAAGVPCGSNTQ